jgi:tripartite-type tricarboxylate transporter receptor subunit TctC
MQDLHDGGGKVRPYTLREEEEAMSIRVGAPPLAAFLALLNVGVCAGAGGDFPDAAKTIELAVPYAPGGPVDVASRVIQVPLAKELGIPVVVVNRAGAGGVVGMEAVLRAKPDGYTLAATANATLVTVPAVNPNVSYELRDFAAIGSYAVDYQAIISRPDSRWKTIEDFIAYARQNPGKLSYGSSGTGGVSYFNMEILKMTEDLQITHVPYQGTGPVKSAILGGHVDVATSAMGAFTPLVQANKLVFLIVTSPKRLPNLPNVPTMQEKGIKSAALNTVMMVLAPAQVPPQALARLRAALAAVMNQRAVREQLETAALIPDYQGPEATTANLQAEINSVKSVMKKLKPN